MARGDFALKGDGGSGGGKIPASGQKSVVYGTQKPDMGSTTGGSADNGARGSKAGLPARAVPAAVKQGK